MYPKKYTTAYPKPDATPPSQGFINARTGQPCPIPGSASTILAKLEELANTLEGLIAPIEELMGVEYAGILAQLEDDIYSHMIHLKFH